MTGHLVAIHAAAMIITPELLGLLRCPETGQTLAIANESMLDQANARRCDPQEGLREGQEPSMSELLTAALVRADCTMLYPIRNSIPVLLIEEAVPL